MKKIEFKYRDGGNYKWNCIVEISDDKFKSLKMKKNKKLEVGDEIFYDSDLGITQDEFHEKRGYPYDDAIDHNILEIISLEPNVDLDTTFIVE